MPVKTQRLVVAAAAIVVPIAFYCCGASEDAKPVLSGAAGAADASDTNTARDADSGTYNIDANAGSIHDVDAGSIHDADAGASDARRTIPSPLPTHPGNVFLAGDEVIIPPLRHYTPTPNAAPCGMP